MRSHTKIYHYMMVIIANLAQAGIVPVEKSTYNSDGRQGIIATTVGKEPQCTLYPRWKSVMMLGLPASASTDTFTFWTQPLDKRFGCQTQFRLKHLCPVHSCTLACLQGIGCPGKWSAIRQGKTSQQVEATVDRAAPVHQQ